MCHFTFEVTNTDNEIASIFSISVYFLTIFLSIKNAVRACAQHSLHHLERQEREQVWFQCKKAAWKLALTTFLPIIPLTLHVLVLTLSLNFRQYCQLQQDPEGTASNILRTGLEACFVFTYTTIIAWSVGRTIRGFKLAELWKQEGGKAAESDAIIFKSATCSLVWAVLLFIFLRFAMFLVYWFKLSHEYFACGI